MLFSFVWILLLSSTTSLQSLGRFYEPLGIVSISDILADFALFGPNLSIRRSLGFLLLVTPCVVASLHHSVPVCNVFIATKIADRHGAWSSSLYSCCNSIMHKWRGFWVERYFIARLLRSLYRLRRASAVPKRRTLTVCRPGQGRRWVFGPRGCNFEGDLGDGSPPAGCT